MTKLGLMLSIIGCICLISTHLTAFLIIGRIFQGLSAAVLLPSTIGLVTDRFSGETLRKAYSYLMIATVGDWFCFIYWWDNITILTLAKYFRFIYYFICGCFMDIKE